MPSPSALSGREVDPAHRRGGRARLWPGRPDLGAVGCQGARKYIGGGDHPGRDDPQGGVLHAKPWLDGVSRSHIIDGRDALHAVLLEIFTDTGVGTAPGALKRWSKHFISALPIGRRMNCGARSSPGRASSKSLKASWASGPQTLRGPGPRALLRETLPAEPT